MPLPGLARSLQFDRRSGNSSPSLLASFSCNPPSYSKSISSHQQSPLSSRPALTSPPGRHVEKRLPAHTMGRNGFRTRDPSGNAASCRPAVLPLVRQIFGISQNGEVHNLRRDYRRFQLGRWAQSLARANLIDMDALPRGTVSYSILSPFHIHLSLNIFRKLNELAALYLIFFYYSSQEL